MGPEAIRDLLAGLGAQQAQTADYARQGIHVEALFPADRLRDAVQALRDRQFLVEDVVAVDAEPSMVVVYHFHHMGGGCRVALRVLADRNNPTVPSIQDIFPGANWHEREQHDFFGVVFEGHPDLSPLILPEDAGDLRPLRKDGKRLKPLEAVLPAGDEEPSGEDA